VAVSAKSAKNHITHPNMKTVQTVDEYLAGCGDWQEALALLREILLAVPLEETIKWGGPVYTSAGKNIAGMAAFKSYAGIWFYQGALLEDRQEKLVNAQEGVTKALRQWRFGSADEIRQERETIRQYLLEAVFNQKQGKTILPEKNAALVIPDELEEQLAADEKLRHGFEALSLLQKRDFAEYIGEAKRAETKLQRLEKIIPMILRGEGLNDKYKKQSPH